MERCYFFSLMLGRYGSGLLFSILEWQYLCLCSTVYLWLRDGCGFQNKMCCCLSLPRPWYHPTVLGGHGSKHVWQLLIYQLSCSLLSLWLPWWGLWSLFSSLLCTHVTVTMDLVPHVGFLFQCILILDWSCHIHRGWRLLLGGGLQLALLL